MKQRARDEKEKHAHAEKSKETKNVSRTHAQEQKTSTVLFQSTFKLSSSIPNKSDTVSWIE